MKKYLLSILGTILCLVASCQKPDDPADEPVKGPELVSSTPADGQQDAEYLNVTAKLTFDLNVMCPTSRRGEISLSPAGEIISIDAYGKEVTMALGELQPATEYTLSLPEGTVTGYNDNPAKAISIRFRTMRRRFPPSGM